MSVPARDATGEANTATHELLAAEDGEFIRRWRAIGAEERSALPRAIELACVERYGRLTPWVAESITRAEREAKARARAPIDGAALLDAVCAFIARFIAFPSEHCLTAATLWAAHAHMVQRFHTTPRLALLSPEPESAKTRTLEVLALLVPDAMFCLNASPAAIFRTLSNKQITLLADECDTIFARRGKDDANEDLRALLNAGYRGGATIPRCVGPRHDVQMFPVYCAVALAGLGDLPETVMSRAIVFRMRRRAPDELIEPFRSREHEPEGLALRDRLAAWVGSGSSASSGSVAERAGAAWPPLPDGVVDRQAEIWEPLIAVADVAGGEWPQAAREACVALAAPQGRRVSLGVRLLADLRTIFGDANALSTETILARLCDGEKHGLEADAPWNEMHGRPLSVRGLASMLKRYSVNSIKVKTGGRALQGYRREHLWDAWSRYLPPVSENVEPSEPVEPSGLERQTEVPEVPEVPDSATPESVSGGASAGNGEEVL